MNEVEIRTVDTILDKGVRVPIPAPLFLRVFGKKTVNVIIRRSVMYNLLLIAKEYIRLGVNEKLDDDFNAWTHLFVKTAKPVSRIVAIGILRGVWPVRLFSGLLAAHLRRHINCRELASLAAILVTMNGVQDFLNTIRFLGTMRITRPRNLSPEEEGSQKAG